jgi:tetratricopeptide (TPR) repeat protein
MKKVVLTSLLAAAALAPCALIQSLVAQAAPAGGGVQMSQEEYAKYNTCATATAAAAKATACEAYLTAYPNSAVKDDVLNQLLYAYSQTGDKTKALDTADRLLAIDPNNLRALTFEVFTRRTDADALTDPAAKQAALDKVATYAQTGLKATQPKDVSADDFKKLKDAASPTFESAIADDDLAKKDSADAIKELKTEIDADQADTEKPSPVLQDVYVLAQAYYTQTPPDYLNCAWYATRASNFAPEPYKTQIGKLASYCYTKYHGTPDGYPAMQTAVQTNVDPPAGFTVTPAPKPADIVANLIATTPDLATLAVSDKEFVLQYGTAIDPKTATMDPATNKPTPGTGTSYADEVFNTVKGKSVEIPGAVVVAATADQLQVAVSDDSQQAAPKPTADFTFNMKQPLKTVPNVGDKVTLDGTYASYTSSPLMITMSDASVVVPKPAHAPAHHAPVRRR